MPRTDKVSVGYLHPGKVSTCFMQSKQDLLLYDLSNRQRIMSHAHGEMGKQCGAAAIADGRNAIARAILDESDADYLWMVDSDMGFEPDIVDRLVEVAHAKDRPVVGGLAFAHKTDGKATGYGIRYRCQPTLYDWYEDDDQAGFVPRFRYDRDTLAEVGATGAACVLIHRLALEAIRDRYGDQWFDPIRHPKITNPLSEDLSFCVRVAACDMPLHVHTGIKTGHDKGGVYYDEPYYLAQQVIRDAVAGEEAAA